jgi:hypothetical protein
MQINKFLYIINKFVNVVTNNFLKTRNTVAFLSSLSLLQNTTTVHHRSPSLSNPNPDHQNVAPGSGGALASTRRHHREPHQGLLIVDRRRRRDLLFVLFFFLEILQIGGFVLFCYRSKILAFGGACLYNYCVLALGGGCYAQSEWWFWR